MNNSDRNPLVSTRKQALTQQPGPAANPPPIPDTMGKWLGQLTLLSDVPFEYLVPNAQMLPTESLRFFYVDRNWLDSLVDGAFSAGKHSSRDAAQHAASNPAIRSTADASTSANEADGGSPRIGSDGVMTGLLLRSTAVSGYPRLQIEAYADVDRTTPLALLRHDQLTADVLICIWSGVPMLVDIAEPPEGLHFGAVLFTDTEAAPTYRVALRRLTSGTSDGTPYAAGQEVELPDDQNKKPQWVDVPFRDPSLRVVDVTKLVGDLTAGLQQLHELSGASLSPGTFALEMVKSAERQTFERSGA